MYGLVHIRKSPAFNLYRLNHGNTMKQWQAPVALEALGIQENTRPITLLYHCPSTSPDHIITPGVLGLFRASNEPEVLRQ